MAHLDIIFIFVVLIGTLICFIKEWASVDIIALCALGVVIVFGYIDGSDVAHVFSNPAPLTIGAMFVISAALSRTGVIDRLATLFKKAAGNSEWRALLVMALIIVPISACMNNTPVVVVFLPIVLSFARDADLRVSRLLIPLSFFSILGGTITLLGTSTNLLVAGIAAEHQQEPFGIFEISKLGLIYAGVGSLYLLLFSRKLLPNRDTLSSLLKSEDTRAFYTRAIIPDTSPLIGKNLGDSNFIKNKNIRIYDMVREDIRITGRALDSIVCAAGDVFICRASSRGIGAIQESNEITFPQREKEKWESGRRIVHLVEAVISPGSEFVGQTIKELRLRQRFGVLVAAVHRKGLNLREGFEDERLAFGDTLLLEGPEENMGQLGQSDTLLFLNHQVERPYRHSKAPIAIATLIAVMVVAALGILPILSAAVVGAVIVLLTRCIETKEAYASIEWPLLFLIFGMLGLGQAMENCGAAALLAESITGFTAPWGPLAVLAVVYILAATLTEMVTNNAVAILLTPIAITVAEGLGVNARPFIVAVMFAASASFATPIGYQTNTYVFGAGGYKFTDFPKIGLPLDLLLFGVAMYFIPKFWPF